MLVRLIQMGGVDLSTFRFDPHVSWALFTMNADKTIYGRYGRSHPSAKRNRKDSNPNPTVPALKAALKKSLEIHAGYVEDPEAWAPRLAGKTGPKPRWAFAEATPSARKYKRLKRIESGEQGCVHCHDVHRTELDSHFMKKLPVPDSLLWLYPRPHVLGLRMDRRRRANVLEVASGSDAAAAGLRKGDDIESLGGQPLVSVADLQWVLHGFADEGGALDVVLTRGGKRVETAIELPAGWRRREDFAWRYRTFGYAQWLWLGVSLDDVVDKADRFAGVRVAGRSPGWFKRPNQDGRRALAPGDVITHVDGEPVTAHPAVSGGAAADADNEDAAAGVLDRSGLLAYAMRDKPLGSRLRLTVIRKGKPLDLEFRLPRKRPEVMGY